MQKLNLRETNLASSMHASLRPLLSRLNLVTAPHHFFGSSLSRRTASSSIITAAAAQTEAEPAQSQLPRVVLKGGKTKLFTDQQSPIVYGGAVDRVVGRPTPKSGDTVLVCAGDERPIAWGLYNPTSMYRVRIMQTAEEVSAAALINPSLPDILQNRIAAAAALRRSIGLPSPKTSVYRLINSEGDRISGLVADVLGSQIVVSSSAAWVERHRSAIETALLKHVPEANAVIWRRAAELTTEEGWESETESQDDSENSGENNASPAGSSGSNASGEEKEEDCIVLEGGAKFSVEPRGQKTGFYADQRDHRAFISSIAAGRDVLDMCCYSGGFSVLAALAGATSAHGVDSSAGAIGLACRNAELNNVQDKCTFEKADSSDYMRRAADEGKQWDIVVLDPPKLAPSRKALQGAMRKYASLNSAAMRLVRPGGLLMTCSCSGAVAQSGEFVPMLQRAASRAGRRVTVLRVGGASPDHPLDPGYPEGQYLTNICLRVA